MHWKTSSKSCFGETRWQLSLAEEDATGWKYFGHTCNHPHKLLIDQSDCSNSFSYGIVSYSVHISTGSLPTSTYCTWQEAALERGSSNVQFIKHLWNNIATSVNHVMLTYGHVMLTYGHVMLTYGHALTQYNHPWLQCIAPPWSWLCQLFTPAGSPLTHRPHSVYNGLFECPIRAVTTDLTR